MESLDSHKRVLGILYLISGTLSIFGMLLLNTILSFIFSFALNDVNPDERKTAELVLALAQYVPVFVILFFSLPTLIAAFGLLAKKSWGTMFALIMGCFKLFSFPIGTAIGIYAIWIYSEDQKFRKSQTA